MGEIHIDLSQIAFALVVETPGLKSYALFEIETEQISDRSKHQAI